MRLNKKLKLLAVFFLILFNVLAFLFFVNARTSELKVYFFDIGQGDATFVETPNGRQVLIDGGPDNKVIQKLSEVMPFWDRTIDFLILTNPDRDHMAGLLEVLKRYKVKGIIESGIYCEKPDCLAWQELKEKEKALIIPAKLGESIILDKDAKLVILHPFENLSGEKISGINNASVVAKLTYGDYSVLLTGDIEKQVEEKLVLAGVNVDSDYLKIAHHGSKTSSAEEFLDEVSPLAAFISLGINNRYGHPHQEVIDRLEKRNIKYYRTDELGTVLLSCELNTPCQIKKKN